MELSPKQQSVELVKKAKRILILGHSEPTGDSVGSALALSMALKGLGKNPEVIVSGPVPSSYSFLPGIEQIKSELKITNGKVLRIDTDKVPVSSMKYQKNDHHLDIILEADKNLKFEFIEIINGDTKPDLIFVLDTAEVAKIDKTLTENSETLLEVPIVNIDHHSGNEYFGAVNLVDLTATSTAEILVSLFEALGIKISDPETATCLLTGIVDDTGSFRSGNTTPKSLTVAAQLLAAGGKQQEIISNLYKKQPMALLKLWSKILSELNIDEKREFAWATVSFAKEEDKTTNTQDAIDAADELLGNTPEAKIILILAEDKEGEVFAKLKAKKGTDILPLAKIFNGNGTTEEATFKISGKSLRDAELFTLKKINDFWSKSVNEEDQKAVWDIIEKTEIKEELSTPKTVEEIEETEEPLSEPQTKEEIEETTPVSDDTKYYQDLVKEDVKEDPIDNALESLVENQKNKNNSLTKIDEVIKKRKREYLGENTGEEIDVFDEEDEL